ncbi:hypothetical protein HMPREF0908_1014 [Selenomonas flueggei ATCC 43531]|uniref:Uncharacterized protein n=1 Tax=Selenomonas flueggei ATCC 43531 TaxID=638302 RepID=C4V3C0_9FIRM|nr:hypothetical protein HMPREF0908_1014 [Selenomonas flueggei ATCC 43531]
MTPIEMLYSVQHLFLFAKKRSANKFFSKICSKILDRTHFL